MTDDPRPGPPESPPESFEPCELEPLMAAAFGESGPHSVLATLEGKLGDGARVLLREEETGAGSPLIDPRTAAGAGLPRGRGNVQLLGEIARGGMGVVFKGHDVDLGRDVALKVLHDDLADDPAILSRFVEEAQIGGQLQHPGIVPVYELGLMADERPFFTMKLVKGRTLSELLAEHESPSDDRGRLLSVFEDVCQTMAYAHSRGVIHRDLKPSNVMVGAFGEVQVVDWGLAKVLRGKGSRSDLHSRPRAEVSVIETVRSGSSSGTASDSLAGSVMGTPAYMSPEQAAGEVEDLDLRTDVFALGAMLCELLTGKPPYSGSKQYALDQARAAKLDDALQRLVASGAEGELVGLARSCLAPDPADRPRDAGKVAAQLSEYFASTQERARRAKLRAARTVGLSISAMIALALGTLAWLWVQDQRNDRLRATARSIVDELEDASVARGRQDWAVAHAAIARAQAILDASEAPATLAERVDAHLEAITREEERDDAEKRRTAMIETFVRELRRIRFEHPHDKDPQYVQAFAAIELDADALEAIAFHERVKDLGLEEEVAQALHDWGIAERDRGRPDRSLIALAALVDTDDERSQLRAALANFDQDRFFDLVGDLNGRQLPPTTAYVVGLGLANRGRKAEAARVLESAILFHPDDFQLRVSLGLTLLSSDPPRYGEALRHLEAGRALVPGRGRLLGLVAQAQLGLGEAEKAAVSLRRALEFEDGDIAWTYDYLAVALSAQGRTDEAISVCQESLIRWPSDAPLLSSLAWLLSNHPDPERRDVERAVESAQEAVRLSPTASCQSTLGLAYYRAGLLFEGIESLKTSLAAEPDGANVPENLIVLAMARSDLGQQVEARRAYDAAVAWTRDNALDPTRTTTFERLRAEAAALLAGESKDDE